MLWGDSRAGVQRWPRPKEGRAKRWGSLSQRSEGHHGSRWPSLVAPVPVGTKHHSRVTETVTEVSLSLGPSAQASHLHSGSPHPPYCLVGVALQEVTRSWAGTRLSRTWGAPEAGGVALGRSLTTLLAKPRGTPGPLPTAPEDTHCGFSAARRATARHPGNWAPRGTGGKRQCLAGPAPRPSCPLPPHPRPAAPHLQL